jgi:hypothetical protein
VPLPYPFPSPVAVFTVPHQSVLAVQRLGFCSPSGGEQAWWQRYGGRTGAPAAREGARPPLAARGRTRGEPTGGARKAVWPSRRRTGGCATSPRPSSCLPLPLRTC